MTTQQKHQTKQMTIAEAARVLDVSEQTVRRRIKAGKIDAELVHYQFDLPNQS